MSWQGLAAAMVFALPALDASGWTTVTLPQFPPDGTNVTLNSVDARADNDVWAVGTAFGAAGVTPNLPIYHWNGTTWTISPTPALPATGVLSSVSASAAAEAWAVGFTTTGYHATQPVALRWDGSSWSPTAVPGAAKLTAVADLGPGNAWAVGRAGRFGPAAVEHWDGTAWTAVTIPHPTPAGSGLAETLVSITARSATDIWAIGAYSAVTGPDQSFALHYDGTTWTLVPMPADPSGYRTYVFNSVSAAGPDDVWAVGQQVSGSTPLATLTAHWNGSAWSVVPSPTPGIFPVLRGVSARATNDVLAVGYSPAQAGGQDQAVALHWDGHVWSIMPTPTVTDFSELNAVSARSGIWAVGNSRNGPLALHHS